jgi:hypothetical protein
MKFKAIVNPFLKKVEITGMWDKSKHTIEIFFSDTDEWNAFEMNNTFFDIHFLYLEDSGLCIEIYNINGTGSYTPEVEVKY